MKIYNYILLWGDITHAQSPIKLLFVGDIGFQHLKFNGLRAKIYPMSTIQMAFRLIIVYGMVPF